MRDIKFRAWNAVADRMYEVLILADDYIEAKCSTQPMLMEHVDIMEYIGLKDTDGREICESDVCEIMYYTPFGDKTNDFYGRWVVKKWMGQFVLVSGKERLSFLDFANSTGSEYVSNLGTVLEFSERVNVRVIGNIHQNPGMMR